MIMAKYFVDFSSWVEVEADSADEAKAKFWNGGYDEYGECEITGIEKEEE